MNKAGILVEFTLYKIGFRGNDGKGTVNILQMIFWRFQQCLAIRITFAFAGRMEDTGIDQVCKNSVQIILVLVASFDGTADLIQAELGNKRLQEEISTIEKPLFILCDACPLTFAKRRVYWQLI